MFLPIVFALMTAEHSTVSCDDHCSVAVPFEVTSEPVTVEAPLYTVPTVTVTVNRPIVITSTVIVRRWVCDDERPLMVFVTDQTVRSCRWERIK